MGERTRLLGLLVASSLLLLVGCSGTGSDAPSAASPPKLSGMNMTDEQMAAMDSGPRPSETAKMVCSNEIRHSIKVLLKLATTPKPSDDWADGRYTCSYHLPIGHLVLSVQDSKDEASGRAYFDKLRGELGDTTRLDGMQGLGLPAFETQDGNVVFLKDGKTLHVDATRLPGKVPPNGASSTDVAYTIATDVIACWSE